MSQAKGWRRLLGSGLLLAALLSPGAAGAAEPPAIPPASPPTYGIPLRDGRTATVWWDAVSDPAHPKWRCEVPLRESGGGLPTTVRLTAAAGDWRAALAEAKAALEGLVADGE